MDKQELVQKIRSMGAFIDRKFCGGCSKENLLLGREIFEEHQGDISLATGALYVAMPYPVNDPAWVELVKRHYGNLKGMAPQTAIEFNNKAFAYDAMGYWRDITRPKNRIIDPFDISMLEDIVPMHERASEEDDSLWEQHYNLAQIYLGLFIDDESDPGSEAYSDSLADYERAFKELETALEKDPDNIHVMLFLAWSFYNHTDPLVLCRRVLELDPENEEARRLLSRFQDSGFDFGKHSLVGMVANLWPSPVHTVGEDESRYEH